jgi:hypothetical protein
MGLQQRQEGSDPSEPRTHAAASSIRPDSRHVDELLDAARSGDRAAFDRHFDVWLRAVYARAWRLTSDRRRAEGRTRSALLRAIRAALERR